MRNRWNADVEIGGNVSTEYSSTGGGGEGGWGGGGFTAFINTEQEKCWKCFYEAKKKGHDLVSLKFFVLFKILHWKDSVCSLPLQFEL